MRRGHLVLGLIIAAISLFSYYSVRQTNPVTGQTQHIPITPDQEIALGLESAPEMADQFGALDPDASIQADVAASDDFGYTYGRYELRYEGSPESQKGYYVRVWKRDEQGRWRIVLDTATILPAEEK